jgi:hypothetical protein
LQAGGHRFDPGHVHQFPSKNSDFLRQFAHARPSVTARRRAVREKWALASGFSPLFLVGRILEQSAGLQRFLRFHFTVELEAGNIHEVFRVVRHERDGVAKRAGR